jgi:tetratricopeptide (TPR) repeat protein
MGLYETAFEKEKHAYEILEKRLAPNDPDIALARRNLAEDLIKLGRYTEAKDQIKKAAHVLKASNKDSVYMGYINRTAGELYYALALSVTMKEERNSYLEKAEKKYLKSLHTINNQTGVESLEAAKVHYGIAKVYEMLNKTELALDHLNKSCKIRMEKS